MKKTVFLVILLVSLSSCCYAAELIWSSDVGFDTATAIAISPKANKLAVGTTSGALEIYDLLASPDKTNKPISTSRADKVMITALSFSHDQTKLAICNALGKVTVVSRNGELLGTAEYNGVVRRAEFSSDDKYLMLLDQSKYVNVLDLTNYTTSKFNFKSYRPRIAHFGINTGEVIAGYLDAKGDIVKGNIAKNKPTLKTAAHQLGITALAVNNDSNMIVTAGQDGYIRTWNEDSLLMISEFSKTATIDELVFNTSGTAVFAVCRDGTLAVWDVLDGTTLDKITNSGEINALSKQYSHDVIALAYTTGKVFVYKI